MKKISTFCERLKLLMDLNSLNANALASKINVNKSVISRYLSGQMTPRQDRIDLISNLFNVNHAWLLGYDCEMYKQNETKAKIIEALKEISDEETIMQIYLYIKKLLRKN